MARAAGRGGSRDGAQPAAAGRPGHLLGTDGLGRDVWARLLHSALPTLVSGILPAAAALPAGVLLGLLAGYYGGWVDVLISRTIDVVMAFPIDGSHDPR